MDATFIIMWVGFFLASYSVVGNDTIQTLGTFLSSNEKKHWMILFGFAGAILVGTLVYGWMYAGSERVTLYDKGFELVDGSRMDGWAESWEIGGEPFFVRHQYMKDSVDKDMYKALIFTSSWDKSEEEQKELLAKLAKSPAVDVPLYKEADGLLKIHAVAEVKAVGLFQAEVTMDSMKREATIGHAKVKDVSYNRLEKYDLPYGMPWYYLLPPLILMLLTRTGIPVSTSFLILTFFNPKNLESMVVKSVTGYVVAFGAAFVLYLAISKLLEKRFAEKPATDRERNIWTVLQWCSTGFLWSQWLIQDFANIYVYLPRDLDAASLVASLVIILGLLGYIVYSRGGAIQQIVKSKSNTVDIRSATIIDACYGVVLYYFKELNNVPMSTTWVFIGILAGREIAINLMLNRKEGRAAMFRNLGMDLAKVFFGLVVSIVLVYVVKWLATMGG